MSIPSVPSPAGTQRSLTGKLKSSWTLDSERQVFCGPRGHEFDPSSELPQETLIAPVVPALLKRSRSSLSTAERELMLFIHVIFPAGIQPESQFENVKRWPCFQSVTINPLYELPSGGPGGF